LRTDSVKIKSSKLTESKNEVGKRVFTLKER
jgi:hypothetical protein